MNKPKDTVRTRTIIERGIREKGAFSGDPSASNIQTLKSMISQRVDEKREMQELNDKFASYLERVKFLENQNKRLESDLTELRSKWGFESGKIRDQFDNDLDNLRRQLDDATSEKALMELRLKRALYDIDQIKKQIDFNEEVSLIDRNKLANLMHVNENIAAEMTILEKRYRDTSDDINHYMNEIEKLRDKLKAARTELDNESLNRIKLQNEIQTLDDTLAFIKAIHEEEINEFRALAIPAVDSSQFYRTELTKAISNIRRDFDNLNRVQQGELEEYYRVKTEEIREQAAEAEERRKISLQAIQEGKYEAADADALDEAVKKARTDAGELQKENIRLENVLRELEDTYEKMKSARTREEMNVEAEIQRISNEINEKQQVLAAATEGNVSLKFEINTYRRLLESEEGRLAQQQAGEHSSSSYRSSGFVADDIRRSPIMRKDDRDDLYNKPGRVSVQKSSRGPIEIADIDPNGDYILIVNNSSTKDQDLKNWSIQRKVDSYPLIIYNFPINTILRSRASLKIFGRNNSRAMFDRDSITNDLIPNWGAGNYAETHIIGDDGKEKATYVQKFI